MTIPPARDDRALMRDVNGGSPPALAALCERTLSVLYPLALRISGTAERACCVIEELFDEVWRDREGLRAEHGIPLAAMIRRCRELSLAQAVPAEPRRPMSADEGAGAAGARGAGAAGGAGGAGMGAAAPEPAYSAPAGEDLGPFVSRRIACEALAALPERDRLALEEAFFRGTAAREIAVLVGAPTSEAEAMLRSALVRFRGHVREPGEIEAGTGTGATARAGTGAATRARTGTEG